MKKIDYAYQIDSFRLFAMITIFWNHCSFLKLNDKTDYIFETYFHYGGIGVEFFIMLSGLLIGLLYANKEWNKKYIIDFIKKKAIRLFPIYWISLLFFLPEILYSVNIDNLFADILSFSLLQSLSPVTWGYYNSPAWTISTLWIMYLLSPLFSKFLDKIINIHQVFLLLFLIVIGYVVNNFFYYSNESTIWFFYISPFYRWITFVQGMIVGRLLLVDYFSYMQYDYKKKSIWELGLLLFFFVLFFTVSRNDHSGFFYSWYFVIFLYVFYFGGGAFSKIMSRKCLVNLSKISFSFYLFHWFVTVKVSHMVLSRLNIDKTFFNLTILLIIELLLTFIIAYLITRYVENPICRILYTKNGINKKNS